jgi:two-component system chemotaxis response regulator CheY
MEEERKEETSSQKYFPILVAEDDPVARRLLEKKLKDWGYRVYKAENGEKAWEILKQPEVRIAILDWMMPGMEGPQLCLRLRQVKKPHYTYLILLTARDTSFDIIQGLEAGADDYMTKPVNFMELRARLQAAHRIIELEDRLLQAQKKLIRLATTDSLTHAWNRGTIIKFIREEIDRYLRGDRPFGLLMVDMDNFKQINDTYGHQAGDTVLQNLVKLFKRNLRNYDRTGRYGGDELIVLLPGSDIYDTGLIAARLLDVCRKSKIRLKTGQKISVTLSIGGTTTDSLSQVQINNLIQTSDRALYLAKKLGRDRVILFGDSIKLEMTEKQNDRKS